VAVFGHGCHVLDVDDSSVVIDKRNGQRNERVPHPEALRRLVLKDEQHAVVGCKRTPEHEAGGTACVVGGHLRHNAMHAGGELGPRQALLGNPLRLRANARRHENQRSSQYASRRAGHFEDPINRPERAFCAG